MRGGRRRSARIIPLRSGRRWRPARQGRRAGRDRLHYALIWAALIGGASLAAPYADDLRSSLRPMRDDCRVTSATDGDTVEMACPGIGGFDARIVGYDSPELFSPGCEAERAAAEAARTHLAALVVGAPRLEVALMGRDKYDRRLVDLRVDGARVTTSMVRDGHGRRYLGGARGGWCGGGL